MFKYKQNYGRGFTDGRMGMLTRQLTCYKSPIDYSIDESNSLQTYTNCLPTKFKI